jgi:hypothetical protein
MRLLMIAVAVALSFSWVQSATAQESKAAMTTRKKLQQKVTLDFKDVGTKDVFDDIKREMDKPCNFKIDNKTGVSNNTKLTYKCKDTTVEKVLNDLSDKYDFGWVVISNEGNNKVDGWVIIRKSDKGKERGYEAGKEPKGKTSLLDPAPQSTERILHLETRQSPRFELAQRD